MNFETANGDVIRFRESGGRIRHIRVGVEFSRWCTDHQRNLHALREQIADLSRPLEQICHRLGLDGGAPLQRVIVDAIESLRGKIACLESDCQQRDAEIERLTADVVASYKRGRADALNQWASRKAAPGKAGRSARRSDLGKKRSDPGRAAQARMLV